MNRWDEMDAREFEYQDRQRVRKNRKARQERRAEQAKRKVEVNA